jgi:hypothetical protein
LTSDAEYIVNNPKRFAKTNVEDFRDFILKKESYKSEIKDSVTACLNNYKRCDQDLFSHLTSIDDELRKTAPKLPEEFPLFDAFTIPLNFSAINGAGQGGGCGWWEMGRIDSVVPSVEESRVVYTVQLYLYDSGADCGGGSYQNPNSTIFGHVIADYEIIDGKINIKSVTTQNLTGVNSMGIGLEQVKKRVEFLNGKKVKQ